MDRDKRWERVKIAVDGLTGSGTDSKDIITVSSAQDAVEQVEGKYKEDVTDEFLKPIVIGDEGRIKGMFDSHLSSEFTKSTILLTHLGGRR